MTRFSNLIAFIILASMTMAGAVEVIPLWPDGAPTPNGLERKAETSKNNRISNVSRPALYVFPAAKPNGRMIIACPGGAYGRLAWDHEGIDMAPWFNSMGITYAVLKYRMPNGHADVPLEDGRRAIALARENASRWGVNPADIGIMGASAGGHFAATLATMWGDKKYRPDFQILLYPVISMDSITHAGSRTNLLGDSPSAEMIDRYSLERRVTSATPPAFIALSDDDRAVPPANGIGYARALEAAGVPASLHTYPTGGHGWGFKDSFTYKKEWTSALRRWLDSLPAPKVAGPMKDVNGVVDNTIDSLNIALTARPVAGSTRRGDNPVLFLVGNSTMRTGTKGNGNNGQWGWGYFMHEYFDPARITVENHALGGMSSRTFYNVLWPDVRAGIRPGDWVIIELGHNDNGPYDSGRARASIPGIGTDSLCVTIAETGKHENVYTYGEYMRRYINDVKARGGRPILMSLTPRNAWDDADSTRVTRVDKTFGLWARQVAEAEGVPFVDLNDISATRFERYGKEKVKQQMFYLDRIHTSVFGARNNVESAVEGIRSCPGLELAGYLLPEPVDTVTGSSRRPGCPVVFTIGDSTVKNADDAPDGMWGWGSVLAEQFDTAKVSVENHAMAGRSARTFIDEGRWDRVYRALQPGDVVLIQFGHNDGGDINTGKARGELPGSGDGSKVFKMERDGRYQVVYTYGWYLRKYVLDCLEKGAVPVIVSPTPRNIWHDGVIESRADTYAGWAREVAERTGAAFIDLNALAGAELQAMGQEKAAACFHGDHTHTSLAGARLNAAIIARRLPATGAYRHAEQ